MARRATSGLGMTQPSAYLTRMFLFLLIVAAAAVLMSDPLKQAFLVNPILNGVIVGVLSLGVIYAFSQAAMLRPEVSWVNSFRRGDPSATDEGPTPPLLAPMAMMLADRKGPMSLTPTATRTILDSVGSRLDEGRDINRYLIGLCVFLGLLGTFWGLMQTVNAVGTTINSLSPGSDASADKMFEQVREGLRAPLSGMGTAFASSLLGLAGSLILGFLDLQVGQAQGQFYRELEEWLSTVTRIGGAGPAGEGELPGSLNTLIERTTDSIEALERTVALSEVKKNVGDGSVRLGSQIDGLADALRAQNETIDRLVRTLESQAKDPLEPDRLHNIETLLSRMLTAQDEGRSDAVKEIKAELQQLQQTITWLSTNKPGS